MHLLFDFDGTLVDSFTSAIKIFNILADEFHFKKVSADEAIKLRNLSSKELIQYLEIPFYKIPQVLYQARKWMAKDLSQLPPFANLTAVLRRMKEAKHSLGIVTSNAKENVVMWLELNKLNSLFGLIVSESSYFGKARVLKKIIKKHKLDKDALIYIGDETRDIEAAKQNGIAAIAVTWGFHSEAILMQHEPDAIARTPEELVQYIKMYSSSYLR